MKTRMTFLMAMILSLPTLLIAEDNSLNNPLHKFWICAITDYNSLVDGNYQESKCRANTQYSEPPCREFFLEYEGVDGIGSGIDFKKVSEQESSSIVDGEAQATTQSTTIEIKKAKDQYLYSHSIVKTSSKFTDKWLYNGQCRYYQTSSSEKIYIHKGLEIAR
ncbi:hypothetical protein [Crenothrix sp.]|uniref:hypothetical protein n=1 Tax=Crenothrix sp. TaxID=3100433 RepID=UPI00374D7D88